MHTCGNSGPPGEFFQIPPAGSFYDPIIICPADARYLLCHPLYELFYVALWHTLFLIVGWACGYCSLNQTGLFPIPAPMVLPGFIIIANLSPPPSLNQTTRNWRSTREVPHIPNTICPQTWSVSWRNLKCPVLFLILTGMYCDLVLPGMSLALGLMQTREV